MKVTIQARLMEARRGVLAVSVNPLLAGQGIDSDDAVESLRHISEVWCAALDSTGRLERALKQRRIEYDSGDGPISVIVECP